MKETFASILRFFNDKPILKNLVLALLFVIGMLLLTLLWLRIYTNHGQKIAMPNLIGKNIYEGIELAEDESFEVVVTDSVFFVGKKGGIIHRQNPQGGAMVKEDRKIYVSITKFTPDQLKVKDLPVLYGNDFSQKKTELEYRGIKSAIKDRKYDPGEPNHILEVYYKGRLIIDADNIDEEVSIDKGGTLEFVVSDSGGGEITIPSVLCMTYAEAEFLLEQSKLGMGIVNNKGEITDQSSAYILSQNPPYDGVSKILMGKTIDVTIVQTKPSNCQ